MAARSTMWVLAGAGGFGFSGWAAGRMVPGYSHRNEPISALASSGAPSSPVMVTGFVVLAGATAGLASSVRGTPKAPAPVPALLVAAAGTTLGAGLARCSSRSCPSRLLGDDAATTADEIHGAFSMATFLLWIAAPVVAARRAHDSSHSYRAASCGVAVIATSTLLIGGTLTRRRAATGVGSAQRAMVATALGWFLLVAS